MFDLTTDIAEIERNNCMACGMDDFIDKLINSDQLCEILKLHLKTRVKGVGRVSDSVTRHNRSVSGYG